MVELEHDDMPPQLCSNQEKILSYSKEFVDGVKEVMRENRKHNADTLTAEQKIDGLLAPKKSNAPFLFYLKHVLKRGDKPPRGKFFKNRVAGLPVIICDELWYHSENKLYR